MTKKQARKTDIFEHRSNVSEYYDILTIEKIMGICPIFRYTLTDTEEKRTKDIDELIPIGLRKPLADYFNNTISKYKKELEKNIKDYLCQEQQ